VGNGSGSLLIVSPGQRGLEVATKPTADGAKPSAVMVSKRDVTAGERRSIVSEPAEKARDHAPAAHRPSTPLATERFLSVTISSSPHPRHFCDQRAVPNKPSRARNGETGGGSGAAAVRRGKAIWRAARLG
jgi:hypothetical protein